MALPVGEARYVKFDAPGTDLLSGAWSGTTQVLVFEHRSDGRSVFVRPFLEGDDDEDGDREENLREVPTQKTRGGKQYTEFLVFDTCETRQLPTTLPVQEPENISQHVASFDFAQRKGDSLSLIVLREYCPEHLQPARPDWSSVVAANYSPQRARRSQYPCCGSKPWERWFASNQSMAPVPGARRGRGSCFEFVVLNSTGPAAGNGGWGMGRPRRNSTKSPLGVDFCSSFPTF